MPTLVSTLAISCVFVSVVFLHGPAKYLFTPLGLAVVFAMLASYALSRTLTPITIGLLLKSERHGAEAGAGLVCPPVRQIRARLREHARRAMRICSTACCGTGSIVPSVAAIILLLGGTLFVFVGRDFFPVHRWRPDPASRAGAGRHPHREDRADLSGGRGQDPRGHSGGRARSDRRQHRPAGAFLQFRIRRRHGDRRQ